jgi:hypothetical protein
VSATPEERLRPELEPGERLLWSGQPHLSWLVRADLYGILFSLVTLVFGVLWEHAALTDKNANGSARYGTLFHVWGLLFIIFGLYTLLARFPARRLLAARTAYGITDRRALAVKPSPLQYRRVTSTPLTRSLPVTVRPLGGGRGSVVVGALPGTVVFWNLSRAEAVAAVATDAIAAAEP